MVPHFGLFLLRVPRHLWGPRSEGAGWGTEGERPWRTRVAGDAGFIPGWVWKIPWRRIWQPTPEFLPGKSHGQRSLAGYSPQDLKESDTTEQPNDILFWILFHYRLLQVLVLHSRSLLSVLYIIMCIRSSQTPNFSPSIPRIRFGNHKFVSCDSISVL